MEDIKTMSENKVISVTCECNGLRNLLDNSGRNLLDNISGIDRFSLPLIGGHDVNRACKKCHGQILIEVEYASPTYNFINELWGVATNGR